MSTVPTGEDWGGFVPPPDGPYASSSIPVIDEPPIDPTEALMVAAEQGEPEEYDDEPVVVEPEVELPEFSPEHREPFMGLMHVGALTHDFDFVGHHFRIRTLRDNEEQICGELVGSAKGTLSETRRYQTLVAAACIMSVDGQPIYRALGPVDDEVRDRIEGAYRFITANWYPVTIDRVFTEFFALDHRVREVVVEMGKVL